MENSSIGEENNGKQTCKNNYPEDEYHIKCVEETHPFMTTLHVTKSIIHCYVLSMWDNIVGPKAVYVWNTNDGSCSHAGSNINYTNADNQATNADHNGAGSAEDELDKVPLAAQPTDVTKYVAEHSISLADVNKFGKKHVTSWLTAPHQYIAFLSIRFALEESHPKVPSSLSSIVHYEDRHNFRPYLEICSSQMQAISNKISILFEKDGLFGVKRVTNDLVKLTNTISTLMRANLATCIPEHLPETPVNRHLAALMLTSHLQTRCSTLVIASSLNVANKVILWLSQFSPEKNLPLSCLCLSESKCLYSNGPYIQAIIRDSRGQVDLATSNMLCAGLPLTIVDLTKDTVRQFAPSATQQKMCIQALQTELVDLYGGCKSMGAISCSIFHTVDVIAPLVKNFLQEWNCLAECNPSVRREYLYTFKQSLYYDALSISVFVRNKCKGIRHDEKSEVVPDFKPEILLREIKSFLQLEENDVKILLAKAESFDPGITSFIFR